MFQARILSRSRTLAPRLMSARSLPRSFSRLLLGLVFSSASTFAQPTTSSLSPAAAADRPGDSLPTARLQPNYPTPYVAPSVEQIEEVLRRVHGYLETASPIRVINSDTREPVTDLAHLPPHPNLASAEFRIVSYEWGVTYAGLLLAANVTGDARYSQYVADRLNIIARLAAQMKPQGAAALPTDPAEQFRNQLRPIIAPRSLDDCGAMCAAMIKAQRAGVATELRPWIDNFSTFISSTQMRLADGTLARNRPLPNSLWLDDLYMSVPALAQMGKLTGERRYFDDAAKQIIQFNQRMFVREKGLYMHGWVEGMQDHPAFHWARANGWAIMAAVELLDVLPEDHPARPQILEILRAHVRGLAAVQGNDGLWHQLLDRPDSYAETSGSAMYVFAIARAINRGWIDGLAYGPMAMLGWNAVAQKVNAKGQVEATCVGTGMGWDPMFYMYRPVSVYAAHGYGPIFLAGAEMIELRKGKGAKAAIHDGGLHFDHTPSRF